VAQVGLGLGLGLVTHTCACRNGECRNGACRNSACRNGDLYLRGLGVAQWAVPQPVQVSIAMGF